MSSSFLQESTRVILLLDLDCFYAQCEQVRLGLDPSTPLCLLQWNSALAVNYKARDMGLKRGASFEQIQEQSEGKCICLHLPVVSTADLEKNLYDIDNNEVDKSNTSVNTAYEKEFNLPKDIKEKLYLEERNKMRHSGEGKASLDRYRLASARIFEVILEALETCVGKGNFVLEKASIDELFLDVSSHCQNSKSSLWKEDCDCIEEMSSKETIICAKDKIHLDDDENDCKALRRGCIIARGIRKAVFDRLGFTLSAGVGTSKLVSKLGASYGKPDGQAVVFPSATSHLMENTKIKKARNLGGKMGKIVSSLLPPNEETLGSIARLLSLQQLTSVLGAEMGRNVWNSCRGIDEEPVRETKRALTKSITAFKSFRARNKEDVSRWIELLATDLFARIQMDQNRHNRFPTTCSVQYYYRERKEEDRVGKSIRIPFPKLDGSMAQKKTFITRVEEVLSSKVDITKLCRIGLCAIQFQEIAKNGIDGFFSKQVSSKYNTKPSASTNTNTNVCSQSQVRKNKNEDPLKRKRKNSTDISNFIQKDRDTSKPERACHDVDAPNDVRAENQVPKENICTSKAKSCNEEESADMAYAKKLQAVYDRENNVLSMSSKKPRKSGSSHARIDSFFKK